MIEIIVQVVIFVFGVSAIFLSQHENPKYARWACVLGLSSQPAWMYTAFTHNQWGVFLMAIPYAIAWGKGIKTYWWKR